ncbi:hypothetical protein DESC_710064 [Desulfosarcina cetonica]|nr:hypothetical protein DESC_710064 [Desulfosarcina cetonica]
MDDAHVGVDVGLASVLVFDGGVNMDAVGRRVQGVDNHAIALFHERPAQLAGAGQLVVVRVEFLVQVGELHDLGRIGQILVGLADLFLHQGVDLGFLRQFLITGVIDLLLIGPFADHVVVDAQHGRNEVLLITDDPGVPDVGAELKTGFQVLGREGFAIPKGEHVLGAVKDHQMTVFIEKPLVIGVEPAVHQGFFRGLGVFVVAEKHRGAAGDDFALGGDLDLGAGDRVAHGVELDVAVAVDHRNAGHFRLPVDLFEIDPQGMEETEMVRPHGGPAGVGVSHPGEPQMILELLLHGDVGQLFEQLPDQRYRSLAELQIGHVVTDLGGQGEELAFDPTGVQMLDLHGAGHLFVHARRGEHHVGTDLPNILLGGLGLLGKIDRVADLKPAGNGHHLLADPGKGQVGDIIVRVVARIHGHQVLSHGEHVVVGQQRPLGQRRRSGGIKKQGHVIAMPAMDHLREEIGLRLFQLAPQVHQGVVADQAILMIVAHPLGVVPNDLFQLGTLAKDGKGLVDFFLPLAKEKLRVRMVEDVPDFVDEAILKQPDGHATGAQRGHLGPQAFGTVVADHGDLVAGFQSEPDQSQAQVFDILEVIPPGDRPPEAELLLTHGHAAFAIAPRLVVKQFLDGQFFGDGNAAGRRTMHVLHTDPLHPDRL